MKRVDWFPTHKYEGFDLRRGYPLPFGATIVPDGVNFSIFSTYATDCTLVLFHKHEPKPFAEIPFLREFKIGNVFTMMVFDLDYEDVEYGYRMDGPFEPAAGHWFNKEKIRVSPFFNPQTRITLPTKIRLFPKAINRFRQAQGRIFFAYTRRPRKKIRVSNRPLAQGIL